MKISKIFSTVAVIISLTATTAFAAGDISNSSSQTTVRAESKQDDKKDWEQKHSEFEKDPIKALKDRKEKVQSLVREGKITKEKAEEKTARIDSKIKEVQNFNKLTLQQKKDKLINDCKSAVEERVKDGDLDSAKADNMVKKYTEKINNWDGNGYPKFHSKGCKHKCKESCDTM